MFLRQNKVSVEDTRITDSTDDPTRNRAACDRLGTGRTPQSRHHCNLDTGVWRGTGRSANGPRQHDSADRRDANKDASTSRDVPSKPDGPPGSQTEDRPLHGHSICLRRLGRMRGHRWCANCGPDRLDRPRKLRNSIEYFDCDIFYFPSPTIDLMAGNRYIHLDEYEDQNCSTSDQDDFSGALRPNSAANSQTASGGRTLRLPPRFGIGCPTTHGIPAPVLSA